MSNSIKELVERVVEVTGSTEAEAEQLLGACANNVEQAIALYCDGVFLGNGERDGGPDLVSATNGGEENVRAPIPPIREQLLGPGEDNFYVAPPVVPRRLAHVSQRVKVCPLRDFAREGALMEEQLQTGGITALSIGEAPSSSRAHAMVATATQSLRMGNPNSASSRLGDLFRPPTDIAFPGTFQMARMRATVLKVWLLVNVQSDNFESQLLNRDVWASKDVRNTIKRRLMLWQVEADSSDGRRFIAFYHCIQLPYVCVIDPRTGEEVWKIQDPKHSNLLSELQNFLQLHKDFSSELQADKPTTSKRVKHYSSSEEDEEILPPVKVRKRSKVIELSEEEQMALAIRNSMRENGHKQAQAKANDSDENDEDNDSDSESDAEGGGSSSGTSSAPYELQLGMLKDELTMLKLRLINAEGIDEVVQLRWPSDTKANVFRMYIAQKHEYIAKQGYKIICAFPRKTLEDQHYDCSLKEIGLHPSANLHVSLEDD